MKPHPRIRKTVKWGGAVVSLILLVAWVASGCGSSVLWRISEGRLTTYVRTDAIGGSPSYRYFRQVGEVELSDVFRVIAGLKSRSVEIPVWAIAIPLVLPTLVAWRLDTLARRRARVGLCPKCNYPRTGLAPSAVCPECGTAAAVAGPPG